jgi:hypothetical protein
MDGDTKKRPGQPETARSSPGTGNNARRIGINKLFQNYVLNFIYRTSHPVKHCRWDSNTN